MFEENKFTQPLNSGWDRLSSEEVFKTPVFSLLCERSKSRRTGAATNFYYFKCPDWVNVIAVTPDKQLVMIKQYRHGSGRFELEIPGGGINPGESDPVKGGTRELFEETGYRGNEAFLIGSVCPNPALQGNTCYTVFVRDAVRVAPPEMEDTESIETFLVPVTDIRKMIKDGLIRHGLVLNALHFYEIFSA